ncbi:hypothetical protein BRARA_F02531 [Brassica rapa]|uniref:Prolyl 4-hydroxylase alpha subunit domain-containing protein n=1 Tax=Brassica campestris TaxID=3711 RepID=A0A397Z0R6_BRACM|nr:hypothetical protein BRARA_F02531 [Brassica rapa]
MASKSKNNIRYQPRKASSRSTQAFTVIILLLVVIMILLGLGILSLPNANRNSSKPNDLTNIVRKSQEQSGGDEEGNGERWVEVISWEPRAVVYHNFLTNEECEHLINLAKPNMVKSAVVDEKTGGSKDSRVRTSSGTFLRRGHEIYFWYLNKILRIFSSLDQLSVILETNGHPRNGSTSTSSRSKKRKLQFQERFSRQPKFVYCCISFL